MKLGLTLILSLLCSLGCRSTVSDAELQAATLYFSPTVKIVEGPKINFTQAEREKALKAYKGIGANALFALVVDDEGRVLRARLLRTKERKEYHEGMLEHIRSIVFAPSSKEDFYRCFYYPINYKLDASFEWR